MTKYTINQLIKIKMENYIMSFQLEHLDELKALSTDITLEALDFGSMIDELKLKLKELNSKFKEITRSKKVNEEANIVELNKQVFIRKFNKDNYVANSARLVTQPKGLNVTYIKYISALTDVHDSLISKLMSETLKPLEKHLGTLLTIPDEINSKREPKELAMLLEHDIDQEQDKLKACFSSNGVERRPYRDLVERNSDWVIITDKYNELRDKVLGVERQYVLEYTDLIIDHLDKLETLFDKGEVSRVTLHTVSKFVYSAASEIEFYAVHTYNVEGLGNLLEKMLKW